MMKFNSGQYIANARTVGELIALLQQLPPETPAKQGFSKSVDVVIFNPKSEKPFIEFNEGFSWACKK